MATNKRPETIDAYIQLFPKDVQMILQKIRRVVQKTVPEAEEAMRYGLPTFQLHGKNLVHFAAWKHHIGFYPTPSGTRAFKKELSSYKHAKGSIQFPLDRPIPYELIEHMVLFRAKEQKESYR